MKSFLCLLILFPAFAPSSFADGWDVILVNGETFLNCRLLELRNDSVLVQTKEWSDWFWLGNILRIERTGSAWGTGAILGATLGAAGGAWYAVEHPAATFDQPTVVRGFMGGIIGLAPGALVGAFVGSMVNTGVSYDFTRLSYDERITVVGKIILEN